MYDLVMLGSLFKKHVLFIYLYLRTESHLAFMKHSHLLQDFHHYYPYRNVVAIASF